MFFLEENDHLKAENRSLKKDLLTAIENAASGNKKVPLKGTLELLILICFILVLRIWWHIITVHVILTRQLSIRSLLVIFALKYPVHLLRRQRGLVGRALDL